MTLSFWNGLKVRLHFSWDFSSKRNAFVCNYFHRFSVTWDVGSTRQEFIEPHIEYRMCNLNPHSTKHILIIFFNENNSFDENCFGASLYMIVAFMVICQELDQREERIKRTKPSLRSSKYFLIISFHFFEVIDCWLSAVSKLMPLQLQIEVDCFCESPRPLLLFPLRLTLFFIKRLLSLERNYTVVTLCDYQLLIN